MAAAIGNFLCAPYGVGGQGPPVKVPIAYERQMIGCCSIASQVGAGVLLFEGKTSHGSDSTGL